MTISKIRFLEDEGLVKPDRTASGYRKFSREDVARLRYVLTAQRDQYLPLRVIKEHLDAIDRGLEPPAAPGAGPRAPRLWSAPRRAARAPSPSGPSPARSGCRARSWPTPPGFRRAARAARAVRAAAAPAGRDVLRRRRAVVARTVAEMARFGIEARHLRPFKAAADREVGLLEQVVDPAGPPAQPGGPGARRRDRARARRAVGPAAQHARAAGARPRAAALTAGPVRGGRRPE